MLPKDRVSQDSCHDTTLTMAFHVIFMQVNTTHAKNAYMLHSIVVSEV